MTLAGEDSHEMNFGPGVPVVQPPAVVPAASSADVNQRMLDMMRMLSRISDALGISAPATAEEPRPPVAMLSRRVWDVPLQLDNNLPYNCFVCGSRCLLWAPNGTVPVPLRVLPPQFSTDPMRPRGRRQVIRD